MFESMPSTKNQLQEIWQMHGDKLPEYVTKRIGGFDHQPLYQSVVTLPNMKTFTGEKKFTRVAAEKSAASESIMYSKLEPVPHKIKSQIPHPVRYRHNTYVFADLENIPQAISLVDWLGCSNCIGFVSRKHPMARKQQRMCTVIIESLQKDAADFAIAMHIALFIEKGFNRKYTRLILLTKDHFGSAVREIMKQWWSIDLIHAVSMQDCLKNVK